GRDDKAAITSERRESHDQNLGAKHLGQRAEGDVGGGRARAAARTHRRRRHLRQEQGARLSRHEPQRPGADARRGRLPAVGIELDRALPRGKYGAGKLDPADAHSRARASSWMDWQLTVAHPPLTPVFWGLIRTPPEKRDHAAIEAGKVKCIPAMP